MNPRVPAAVCALLLSLTGCGAGPQDRTAHRAGPAPATTPPVSPTPTLTATRSPKPKPKPKPRPTSLPAGLRKSTGTPAVALTFDDGPDPVWTPKVLDHLRAARVSATFCVVGLRVQRHPELVARIVREGHQLCNHSWGHDVDLGGRPVPEIEADLTRTTRAIRTAVPGARVPFYRQPGGRWTTEVVVVAHRLGMRSLHWNVDPQDWARPTAEVITERVTDTARPGSIVLLHDGGGDRAATLAACPALIGQLKRRYGVTRLR